MNDGRKLEQNGKFNNKDVKTETGHRNQNRKREYENSFDGFKELEKK